MRVTPKRRAKKLELYLKKYHRELYYSDIFNFSEWIKIPDHNNFIDVIEELSELLNKAHKNIHNEEEWQERSRYIIIKFLVEKGI